MTALLMLEAQTRLSPEFWLGATSLALTLLGILVRLVWKFSRQLTVILARLDNLPCRKGECPTLTVE